MDSSKILSNKKLLLVIGSVLLVTLVIAIILLINHPSSVEDIEETNDAAYIEQEDRINDYITANHPIDTLLPIRNESPFYYISLRVDLDQSAAAIEISYYTKEGKQAAEARLKSSDFAAYHPENYQYLYVNLNDY